MTKRTSVFGVISAGLRASLVAQRLKRLPAMWETWVQSLGWEDHLEKEMATTPVPLLGKFYGAW